MSKKFPPSQAQHQGAFHGPPPPGPPSTSSQVPTGQALHFLRLLILKQSEPWPSTFSDSLPERLPLSVSGCPPFLFPSPRSQPLPLFILVCLPLEHRPSRTPPAPRSVPFLAPRPVCPLPCDTGPLASPPWPCLLPERLPSRPPAWLPLLWPGSSSFPLTPSSPPTAFLSHPLCQIQAFPSHSPSLLSCLPDS